MIVEVDPPLSESFSIVPRIERDVSFQDAISRIRNLIVIALGTVKELSSQAVLKYKAPGMRLIIGEIIGCLAQAKHMVDVNPDSLKFR